MVHERCTLTDIKIICDLSYIHLLDFGIDTKYYEHSMMCAKLAVASETAENMIFALKGSSVVVNCKNEELLKGICTHVSVTYSLDYLEVYMEVQSYTEQLNHDKKQISFQNSGKSLHDILKSFCECRGQNSLVKQVIYQRGETDWQFAVSLAKKCGLMLYSDFRKAIPCITIGNEGGVVFDSGCLQHKIEVGKDIQELRMSEMNGEAHASYEFEQLLYETCVLNIFAGDLVGEYQVLGTHVLCENETLINYLFLKRKDDAFNVKASSKNVIFSDILFGTVNSIVEKTNVEVKLDTDSAAMAGGLAVMPYESAMSRSFYSMPDEDDPVFVYYESSGKMTCLGSRRSNTDASDFKTPDEKVLNNRDNMIRMTDSSLILTTTRSFHDSTDPTKVANQITIAFDDSDGITISSGSDITISTTGDEILGLGAMSEEYEKILEERTVEELKEKFRSDFDSGFFEYSRKAGKPGNNVGLQAFTHRLSYVWGDKFSGIKPLCSSNSKSENEAGSVTPVVLSEGNKEQCGVVTIFGLNQVLLRVGDNLICLSGDVLIDSNSIGLVGYNHAEHAITTNEYEDMIELNLDGFQLILDLLGMLPDPVGLVCDLINAGVSLCRGDFLGAGLCALSAIPFAGWLSGASKIAKDGAKVAKAATKCSKLVKAGKVVKVGIWLYQSYVLIHDEYPNFRKKREEYLNNPTEYNEAQYELAKWQVIIHTVRMVKPFAEYGGNKLLDKFSSKPNADIDNNKPSNTPGSNDTPQVKTDTDTGKVNSDVDGKTKTGNDLEENRLKPDTEENKPKPSTEENKPKPSTEENKPKPSTEENKPKQSTEENKPKQSTEENKPKQSTEENKTKQSTEENKTKSGMEEDKTKSGTEEDKTKSGTEDTKTKTDTEDTKTKTDTDTGKSKVKTETEPGKQTKAPDAETAESKSKPNKESGESKNNKQLQKKKNKGQSGKKKPQNNTGKSKRNNEYAKKTPGTEGMDRRQRIQFNKKKERVSLKDWRNR